MTNEHFSNHPIRISWRRCTGGTASCGCILPPFTKSVFFFVVFLIIVLMHLVLYLIKYNYIVLTYAGFINDANYTISVARPLIVCLKLLSMFNHKNIGLLPFFYTLRRHHYLISLWISKFIYKKIEVMFERIKPINIFRVQRTGRLHFRWIKLKKKKTAWKIT